MGTRYGYLGPTSGYLNGNNVANVTAPLQINTNGHLNQTSDGFYTLTSGTILKLDSDEYPTTVSLDQYGGDNNGQWFNIYDDEYVDYTTVTINLCTCTNKTRANVKQLISFNLNNASGKRQMFSNVSISGGTVYANKQLYIYSQCGTAQLQGWCRFNFTTAYISQTISTSSSSGGSIKINNAASASLSRGGTATITITPSSGYKLNSLTASAGTLLKLDNSTYRYTAPTPAVAATITATFTQLPYSALANVGEIILASWYNDQ